MKIEFRWKMFALLSAGAFALSIYSFWKTVLYFNSSSDVAGSAFFGFTALILLIVAGLHLYMAAGYKGGRLDYVTGSMENATLKQGNHIVLDKAKIQFHRFVDRDNSSVEPNERFVFLVCAYRPWVCKESHFLKAE